MEQKTSSKNRIVTIPNILSVFRICLIPVIVWLYVVKQQYHYAGYVFIISAVTDILDGYIARRYQMISSFGKILDPVADKLTQVAMLVCLIFRFPLVAVPLALLIIEEIFMGISGLLVIRKTGCIEGADWHGKAATCLTFSMVAIHIFWYEITPAVSFLLIAACTLMIAVSFALYGVRNVKLLKNKKR